MPVRSNVHPSFCERFRRSRRYNSPSRFRPFLIATTRDGAFGSERRAARVNAWALVGLAVTPDMSDMGDIFDFASACVGEVSCSEGGGGESIFSRRVLFRGRPTGFLGFGSRAYSRNE